MLFCCMAAALLLACSNDKSDGEGREPGVETELNGTQLGEGTTLYGLVTDTSGNPVQGVVVSDGYNCVETDANGVYQMIRYKKARFVWYSTPAGYEINTSADNYPLYYAEIVHKNIADRHDFVLKPLAAPETDFTLLCIADPQCASTADISRYVNETIPDIEATVETFKAKGRAVYGITLGDIVFDTPDLWSNMKEAMGNRNLTIFQTIGNHDHLKTETSDDKAAANFESQFGPRNYSFNRGNAHIVSMDNVFYVGGSTPSSNYKGGITDQQLEWLRQDLSHVAKDKLVIFCAHMPFRGGTSETDESHMNHAGVLDLLSEFVEAHIMIGHTHYQQKYIHTRNGKKIFEHIHGAACGAWWTSTLCADGTPNGYGVYEISGSTVPNQYYKATNKAADHQIRAYSAKQVFGTSGSTDVRLRRQCLGHERREVHRGQRLEFGHGRRLESIALAERREGGGYDPHFDLRLLGLRLPRALLQQERGQHVGQEARPLLLRQADLRDARNGRFRDRRRGRHGQHLPHVETSDRLHRILIPACKKRCRAPFGARHSFHAEIRQRSPSLSIILRG